MITPHATGHVIARDRCLLRVDVMADRWVARRYAPVLLPAFITPPHLVGDRWRRIARVTALRTVGATLG
jgi:hypothetical protein